MCTGGKTHISETLSSVCFWTRRPHCSFHLPTPFSACCWQLCFNTNTVFLSSSPGRGVLLISVFLLQPFRERRWGPEGIWDMGELWETRVKSVASQHASLSLLLPLPFSFSISVSLLAENHRRLHADHILQPQMIWENMPC